VAKVTHSHIATSGVVFVDRPNTRTQQLYHVYTSREGSLFRHKITIFFSNFATCHAHTCRNHLNFMWKLHFGTCEEEIRSPLNYTGLMQNSILTNLASWRPSFTHFGPWITLHWSHVQLNLKRGNNAWAKRPFIHARL
jgi:hypothetical protein